MKFVFALALVAVCVMLMHARPNVKRNADDASKRLNKPDGNHGNPRNDAGKLKKILKHKGGGDKHEHGIGNGNLELPETEAEKQATKEELLGEAEHGPKNDNFIVDKRGSTNLKTIKLWEGGVVDYKFIDNYGENQRNNVLLKDMLRDVADELKQKTGLTLNYNPDALTDVIEIQNGVGCWSWVGYQGSAKGRNEIILQDQACFDPGVIAHEVLHALGFMHENQRTDRYGYINVYDENIDPTYQLQLAESNDAQPIRTKSAFFDKILRKYDYCSIMHYPPNAFSKNGKDTITSNDESILPCMGGHYSLSLLDGEVMAFLYGFLGDEEAQAGCQNDGYILDSSSKCVCSKLFGGADCSEIITDSCGTAGYKFEKVGDEATFSTPREGKAYLFNHKCEWVFKSPPGTKLCVGYPDGFQIEEPDQNDVCSFDWMMIIDDFTQDETKLYCGRENFWAELYDSNEVAVKFNSDDMSALSGFTGVVIAFPENAENEDCVNEINDRSSGVPLSLSSASYSYPYSYSYSYSYS